MKRLMMAILFIGALMMVSSGFAMTGRTEEPKIQKAVVVFDEPIKLLNVMLKGQYLFVHDEGLMAQGKACTYVYNYTDGKQGDLVVSFHCIPVAREKSSQFAVTVSMQAGTNLYELTEYRFAGSTEGHKVPQAR
jgi:hypothetical protein